MLQRENPDHCFRNLRELFKVVDGSKLTTVPKDETIDRCIAIEPTANMFLQQGLGVYIVEKLSEFGVDLLNLQHRHREMALISSVTRKLATIDWSSASDCVAFEVVKFCLPPIWFSVLDTCRSKTIQVDGVVENFPCFSTMGNATTFVLETLIFLTVGMAITDNHPRSLLPNWENLKNVSVFGDDCIIGSEYASEFISVLRSLGFIVNEKKTFIETGNPFRESCGGDYFRGRNVRPYFFRAPRSTSPSNLRAWLYKVWNGVFQMLSSSIGHLSLPYTQTLQYLADLCSRTFDTQYRVPSSDPDDSGLKFFGDYCRFKFLFPKRLTKFKRTRRDVHGTISYSRLLSLPDKTGYYSENLEYARVLKNHKTIYRPGFFIQKDDQSEVLHFSVLKRVVGYVVCEATTCHFASSLEF